MSYLAAHSADAVAIDSASETLTFAQLLARAAEHAPGSPLFPARPDIATVTTILGLLQAGRWAFPLNPSEQARLADCIEPSLEGPGIMVLTSGSSGTPKAALLPLAALRASAERANRNIPLAEGDRWLLSLPLFHVSGLGVLFRCWVAGATVALPGEGQPLRDAIKTFKPTHISLVATQLRRLMADAEALPLLRSMKAILLGGSAMPPALIREAYEAGLPIHKSYGLTEMCSQVCTTRPGADLGELMTSGYPLALDTLRISDRGEIEVSGATLFKGYVSEDKRYTANDWFPTGDLGRFDEKGRLIVLGRKDNMYISGGENIHPEEVERALAGLPGVEQVMVVAVPDVEYGQVGFAFVAMAAGEDFNVEALRAGARAVLPGFKVPKHMAPWPSDLAQAGIKPSRAALQQRALEELNPKD